MYQNYTLAMKATILATLLLFGLASPALSQDCSMTLSSGRKIDLTSLCGGIAPAAPDITANKGDVTLGQWQFRVSDSGAFTQLIGTVSNTGRLPVSNVRIFYKVHDAAGLIVDTGFVRSQPDSIAVGGDAGFKQLITNRLGKRATISEVRWNVN